MTERLFTKELSRTVKRSPRARLVQAIPLWLLAALLLGCVGPDKEATPTGKTRYLADTLVPAYPLSQPAAPSRVAQRKWVGRGTRDVCGRSWAIELTLAGNKVNGEFWLGAIKYDIIGFLDSAGRMDAIPGRKNKFYRNHIGPREMEFSVTFSAGQAKGEHYFSYGRCLTPMRLAPSNN